LPVSLVTADYLGRREKKTWARSSFGSLQETYDPVNVESRSLALTTRPPVLRFSNHPSNHGALWRVYIPTSVQLQNRPVLHVIRECLNGPQLSLLTRRRQTPRGYVQIKQTKGELALKSQNRKKKDRSSSRFIEARTWLKIPMINQKTGPTVVIKSC